MQADFVENEHFKFYKDIHFWGDVIRRRKPGRYKFGSLYDTSLEDHIIRILEQIYQDVSLRNKFKLKGTMGKRPILGMMKGLWLWRLILVLIPW